MLRRVYVWEWPVRLTHWVNFLTILVLSVTGYYIGNPILYAPPGYPFLMHTMRFIHLVAAYVFTISFFIRIYWAFMGNQYARWGEFVPLTRKVWREIIDDVKYYLFLKKEHPHRVGHHALAALTYLGLFFLFLLEIVTGFALNSEGRYGFFATLMGGWLLPYISSQTLRLYHHLFMWVVIAFVTFHIYIGWFIDIVEKNSIITSIFTGYKTLDEA